MFRIIRSKILVPVQAWFIWTTTETPILYKTRVWISNLPLRRVSAVALATKVLKKQGIRRPNTQFRELISNPRTAILFALVLLASSLIIVWILFQFSPISQGAWIRG